MQHPQDGHSKKAKARRNTRHVVIIGSLSRRELEALRLELRRLGKESGVRATVFRVERLVEAAGRRANRRLR
jgi:hypothetical protein